MSQERRLQLGSKIDRICMNPNPWSQQQLYVDFPLFFFFISWKSAYSSFRQETTEKQQFCKECSKSEQTLDAFQLKTDTKLPAKNFFLYPSNYNTELDQYWCNIAYISYLYLWWCHIVVHRSYWFVNIIAPTMVHHAMLFGNFPS